MNLIIFILHNPTKLETLLKAWEEAGVPGATVLTSTGLGRLRKDEGLRDDIPLLPGLKDFFPSPENLSRTLFTVVREDEMIEKVVWATTKIVGDLDEPETGLLIVIPISHVYGRNKTGP